jgi:hypothetical protein
MPPDDMPQLMDYDTTLESYMEQYVSPYSLQLTHVGLWDFLQEGASLPPSQQSKRL